MKGSKAHFALLVTVLVVSGSVLVVVTSIVNERPPWHSSGEWSFDRKLRDEGFATQGGVAVHNSTVHAAYVDHPVDESERMGIRYANVFYVRSDDYGRTWSSPRSLSLNHRIRSYDPLVVIAEHPTVIVAWREYRYVTNPFGGAGFLTDAAVAISRDGGSTWADPIRVNEHDTSSLMRPIVSVSGSNVLVGYRDLIERPGTYIRISSDGGRSWTNESLLPADPSEYLGVDISGDTVFMTRDDTEGNGVPQLVWTTDGGQTWDFTPIDSFDPHACDSVSLLVVGDYVHTVCPSVGYSRSPTFLWNWTEPKPEIKGWILQEDDGVLYSIGPESEVSNGVSHLNVTVRLSDDLGDTWTDGSVLLEGTYPEISTWSVSIGSGRIGVVWTSQDNGLDTREVHFKALSADDMSVLHEGSLTDHSTDIWANLYYSSLFVFLIGVGILVAVLALHAREKMSAGRQ